ncbi:hypothetical protein FKR81_33300 [Lentzea tibetensis]|uniref:Uncharacterized protein n=1 Tax=Lentzea tibetensis TaxID=2591470 RepID=A0A563EL04_9PSEU|nr:DUF5988 family protein [Lentzea tibetensis]TWP46937.1 hypothetical protein FKR81_33300 [Lentzea tibetensis]
MNPIKVALADGVNGQPSTETLYEVHDLADKVKLQCGNGYRHFTYSGDSVAVGDIPVPLFHECGRTKIAE